MPAAKGDALKITDVKTILTAPAGIRLVVVKVMTSEPGLYGLGCATFTQRARVVETAVDKYLRPFLIGKDPLADRGHLAVVVRQLATGATARCSNNAISGVDMALWDILGKRAGHAGLSAARRQVPQGGRYLPPRQRRDARGGRGRRPQATWSRAIGTSACRSACRGWSTYGAGGAGRRPTTTPRQQPRPQTVGAGAVRAGIVPKLFEHLRKQLGDEVELLHDVHERVPPILAHAARARTWSRIGRSSSKTRSARRTSATSSTCGSRRRTPIAMGELFNNPQRVASAWSRERLIDFIRIHISQIGGLTMARKMAALCEFFAVRTAWHGPGDVSPVGHAANVHLDLATPNFGIQEAPRVHAGRAGRLPRLPDAEGRLLLGQRQARAWASTWTRSWRRSSRSRDDPPFDYALGQRAAARTARSSSRELRWNGSDCSHHAPP